MTDNGYVHAVDVPEDFDHASFLSRFGEFRPGPSGKLIDDVTPEAGMDDVYYGGNRRPLLPHTEGYEFAGLPPRYLALWCVTPPAGEGGETTLMDTAPVLAGLSEQTRHVLRTQRLAFHGSAGLRRRGLDQHASHPMLTSVDGLTVLRFSSNNVDLDGVNAAVSAFLNRTTEMFESAHLAIRYQRNDLLHWDNWRLLHSRTAFEDPRRHLKRVQISYSSDVAKGTI
ncbi:TauD/TfdA dioxygenase family protein [Paractinoplanes rishiriensis]|uniref:TauD/TfdA dioxygenase family protein n=1 Tax=Paractinoplanes rishiriensis TaxID=1050105 RepID=UPI001943C303|nr:TauD/TfdA family dioxygenase [Actinoplanes rishiriensis]